MSGISSINEINKIIRNELIELSDINSDFIRDATTEYGVDLDKNPLGSVFSTIEPSDTLILFELSPLETESNMSEDDPDLNSTLIDYYMYFKMDIIMYGENTIFDSLKLASRLRTEEVRDDLISKGIHLSSVSDIRKHEEFINGVIWMRNDFVIEIGCKLEIQPTKDSYEINDYSEMNIYKN